MGSSIAATVATTMSSLATIVVAMLNSSNELGTVLSTVAIVTIVMVVVMPGSVAVQINSVSARAGIAAGLLVDAETSVSHAVRKASSFENVGLVLLCIALCVPSSVNVLLLVGMVTTAIGVRFDATMATTVATKMATTVATMTSVTMVHWGRHISWCCSMSDDMTLTVACLVACLLTVIEAHLVA